MGLTLSDTAKLMVQKVWNHYTSLPSETGIVYYKGYDAERRARLPKILNVLMEFFQSRIALSEFKLAVDKESRNHTYWGFRGINGQMFFNMLFNTAEAASRVEELSSCLRDGLRMPPDISGAKNALARIVRLAEELAEAATTPRSAPRRGSAPYFASYFWQVQDPSKWPVYYTSMIEALEDTEIWTASGDPVQDYCDFYAIAVLVRDFLSGSASLPLSHWDIEHAFLRWSQRGKTIVTPEPTPEAIRTPTPQGLVPQIVEPLFDSYIPPIVAVLPNLAANDSVAQQLAARTGRSVEKIFEERVAVLLRMLGYQVEALGQGMGRVPDGIAVSSEYRYGVIFDAKVRSAEYLLGTDDRAFREYIATNAGDLRRRGVRQLYFMVVSSAFGGEYDDAIRSLKLETEVREVVLAEAAALLAALERRLRDPDIQLGPDGLQRLFANSGILTRNSVLALLGE